MENSEEPHVTEAVGSYGELSTIPEGKEEEEHQEEESTQEPEVADKPKKKTFGFSSFLTKFGVVSTASKQFNQGKSAEGETTMEGSSQPEEKDADPSEENGDISPSVNGEEQNGAPNPVQQYVFGWDEDDVAKNNNSNDHKFQDNPSVSVPVA